MQFDVGDVWKVLFDVLFVISVSYDIEKSDEYDESGHMSFQ